MSIDIIRQWKEIKAECVDVNNDCSFDLKMYHSKMDSMMTQIEYNIKHEKYLALSDDEKIAYNDDIIDKTMKELNV